MPTLSTREKLIQAGHEIFYREGFLAVGLDRLLNEVGCSKQTFYNHFESKDDLIVAVIDEHHRWWSTELQDRLQRAAGNDARGQILAMFDVMHEIINDPDYRGCIYINAAVEFPLPHHPAHQWVIRIQSATHIRVVGMLRCAQFSQGTICPFHGSHGGVTVHWRTLQSGNPVCASPVPP